MRSHRLGQRRRSRFREPSGDGPGVCDHELAVENKELLERDDRFHSAAAGDVGVGKVEKAEHRGQVMAADRGVEGSALVRRANRG